MDGFRLVSTEWANEIDRAVDQPWTSLLIVCPFIKLTTMKRLLRGRGKRPIRVITRFNLDDFNAGVSDLDSLAAVIDAGGQVRGVKGLHAKLYIFDPVCAIVTSANLTEAALLRNHEFGFVSTGFSVVSACHDYAETLWDAAGDNLTLAQIDDWRCTLARARASYPPVPSLGDQGHSVAVSTPLVLKSYSPFEAQAFVKFFGTSGEREPLTERVIDQLRGGSSHWACTYSKRPRQVRDGATMFLSRMVIPNDYRIYGQAIGRAHDPDRDMASAADLARMPWKSKWPYYVRIHSPRCIDATLGDGISLAEMMDDLGPHSFAPTSRNFAANDGRNIVPRRALMQQPQVELTPDAIAWISERLDSAFLKHGTILADDPRLAGTWPDPAQ